MLFSKIPLTAKIQFYCFQVLNNFLPTKSKTVYFNPPAPNTFCDKCLKRGIEVREDTSHFLTKCPDTITFWEGLMEEDPYNKYFAPFSPKEVIFGKEFPELSFAASNQLNSVLVLAKYYLWRTRLASQDFNLTSAKCYIISRLSHFRSNARSSAFILGDFMDTTIINEGSP